MLLTTEDVKKIAYLARLGIDEHDLDSYTKDLSGILDLMAHMKAQNNDGIMPMAHPLDQIQRLRTDAVTETNQRDGFQIIAPHVEEGLYLVPKVIE